MFGVNGKRQITERTFRLVTAGYIKYLEYYYENKADIGVNFLIILILIAIKHWAICCLSA